jgi:hypothetical protein
MRANIEVFANLQSCDTLCNHTVFNNIEDKGYARMLRQLGYSAEGFQPSGIDEKTIQESIKYRSDVLKREIRELIQYRVAKSVLPEITAEVLAEIQEKGILDSFLTEIGLSPSDISSWYGL